MRTVTTIYHVSTADFVYSGAPSAMVICDKLGGVYANIGMRNDPIRLGPGYVFADPDKAREAAEQLDALAYHQTAQAGA